ncbi:hypothetical protein DIQ08_19785, partial [Acinetobacter baumannii]|nr:hypothetical protein [Acinetobacter baumannii]
MPAFEWVHVQLHQQKGMISLSPPTICNSAFSPESGYSSNTWNAVLYGYRWARDNVGQSGATIYRLYGKPNAP